MDLSCVCVCVFGRPSDSVDNHLLGGSVEEQLDLEPLGLSVFSDGGEHDVPAGVSPFSGKRCAGRQQWFFFFLCSSQIRLVHDV
eukprot:SAG11_NODE_8932_length_961_cov_1.511601_2_plen_84_part_00